MTQDDCFELGHFTKTHGLNGELVIKLDTDNPENYYEMESLLLEQAGNMVPFFIDSLLPQGEKLIIGLEDVDSIESASPFVGKKIYQPLSILPTLEEDKYYYHELLGFEIINQEESLGEIKSIYQPSSQYLAAVDVSGKEALIPLEDGIVEKVDKSNKKLFVSLPDGLLEIFTNPNV